MEADRLEGDGEDSAGRALLAFEDDWTTAWGKVGGVACGGAGAQVQPNYSNLNE